MKTRNIFYISVILLGLIAMSSCKKENPIESTDTAYGKVEFGMSITSKISPNKNLLAGSSSVVNAAIVTIEDENGVVIYDTKRITIYQFGDTFISEPLPLEVGSYYLTKFMLADQTGSVIYATPVESSPMAYLVNNPLAIGFSVHKDLVTKLTPEVVPVNGCTAEDFGYTTFSFEIVDCFDFLLGVFVFDESSSNFELTTANLLVTSNLGDTLYSNSLQAITNQVYLKSGYTEYTLKITKNGYTAYVGNFSEDSLLLYNANPLTVILEQAGSGILTLQPGPEEGIDAFIEQWPYENYSNRNFGTHPEFMAAAWTSMGIACTVRNLINFDLSSIPQGASITNATLYLYSVDNTVNGPGHHNAYNPNDCYIQRVTSSWDELSVTWNTQPETTTENQVHIATSSNNMQDYAVNVTALIQDIIDNPSQGHGLMLRLADETYYRRMLFASSDYEVASKRPKIEIEFE